MRKTHPMEDIRASASEPMKAKPLPVNTQDDRLAGTLLATEVMAYAMGNRSRWMEFAKRAYTMTVEARAVVLNTLKAQKAAITKGQTEFGIDEKAAKSKTASMSTQVSEFAAVVNAFNSGADVAGWMAHVNATIKDSANHATTEQEMWDHAGYDSLLAYARTFSKSNAGRKKDTLLVKFGKFIEAQQKTGEFSDDPLLAELVAFYNSKVQA